MSISANYFFAVIVFCFCANGHPIPSDEPYPYFTREDWGAAPSTDTTPLSTLVPYVIIHHTYIPAACNATAQCSATLRSMQKYHRSLGWGDIGYNFAVGSEGGAYEGRGWHVVGIHAGPGNRHSIGIVLIGDWREQLPPANQLATTKALITKGIKKGFISPKYELIGHSQAMSTECPGAALLDDLATWDHYRRGAVKFSSTS